MRYADADPSVPLIRRLTLAVDDGYCTLRWLWPEGVEAVYVERLELEMVEGGQSRDQTVNGKLKLYTREEYKASNGYTDRMTGFGAIRYTIHVCQMDEDGPVLLRQKNDENTVIASAGKADIRFSIRYKSGFFQKRKTVLMTVTAEVPVPKEALCYVRKQGGVPLNKEDGTVYPFVSDFAPGRNEMPPVEVAKDDYVRLFFTDGPRYGAVYRLISD
ncbi:beta-mannanase [Paenibacillus illinoisensis]|uniref:beta-mannanase n=1 Tax=Paenibacillus illinoisensis TaxID=59845 RepID=UPI00301D0105